MVVPVCVARPIYLTLALAWLWRVVLAFVLFRRLAALPLVKIVAKLFS